MNAALLLAARSHFERLDAQQDAQSDPLTGLASWRGLDNDLRRRTSRGARTPFALLFLDADGLKGVNDRFGHTAGNEVLRLIGESCRQHARAQDCVARRGGDEFVVVLQGLGREEAERMMARLQQSVADALAVHPQFAGMGVGVSIGLALFPDDSLDASTLIDIADREMYADKRRRKAARDGGQALRAA